MKLYLKQIYLIIVFSFGPQLCESNILENVMAENPGAKQPPSNRPHNKPPRSALDPFLLLLYPEEKFVSAGMNGLITVLPYTIL